LCSLSTTPWRSMGWRYSGTHYGPWYENSSNKIARFKVTEVLQPPLPYLTALRSTALLTLLRCKFWAVFTHRISAIRVLTLYDFSLSLKHGVW
jgi:hypothetical protein